MEHEPGTNEKGPGRLADVTGEFNYKRSAASQKVEDLGVCRVSRAGKCGGSPCGIPDTRNPPFLCIKKRGQTYEVEIQTIAISAIPLEVALVYNAVCQFGLVR